MITQVQAQLVLGAALQSHTGFPSTAHQARCRPRASRERPRLWGIARQVPRENSGTLVKCTRGALSWIGKEAGV